MILNEVSELMPMILVRIVQELNDETSYEFEELSVCCVSSTYC